MKPCTPSTTGIRRVHTDNTYTSSYVSKDANSAAVGQHGVQGKAIKKGTHTQVTTRWSAAGAWPAQRDTRVQTEAARRGASTARTAPPQVPVPPRTKQKPRGRRLLPLDDDGRQQRGGDGQRAHSRRYGAEDQHGHALYSGEAQTRTSGGGRHTPSTTKSGNWTATSKGAAESRGRSTTEATKADPVAGARRTAAAARPRRVPASPPSPRNPGRCPTRVEPPPTKPRVTGLLSRRLHCARLGALSRRSLATRSALGQKSADWLDHGLSRPRSRDGIGWTPSFSQVTTACGLSIRSVDGPQSTNRFDSRSNNEGIDGVSIGLTRKETIGATGACRGYSPRQLS